MKIGILDESIVSKIVTDILINRPEVINVFIEGNELSIESNDIDSLANYLDSEHGLHLIVNGTNYIMASQINESLASAVAEAGARAADAASNGAFSDTKKFINSKTKIPDVTKDKENSNNSDSKQKETEEFMKKKREEITRPDNAQEEFDQAKKDGNEENGNKKDKKRRVAEALATLSSDDVKEMLKKDPELAKLIEKENIGIDLKEE